MGLVLVTPPTTEPVSLDDVMAHLQIFDDSQNELVLKYAVAAREALEASKYPGLDICLITQTWDLFLDSFPSGVDAIEIPKPPLQAVVSITYTDVNNVATIMSTSDYIVDSTAELGKGTGTARIVPVSSWPAASLQRINGIQVRFRAGFGDSQAAIPNNLQVALMALAGSNFENREASTEAKIMCVPYGFDMYVGLYRRDGIA